MEIRSLYLRPPKADRWQHEGNGITLERLLGRDSSRFWSIHSNFISIQNATKSANLSSLLFPFFNFNFLVNDGKSQLEISFLNILFLVWRFPVFCWYISSPQVSNWSRQQACLKGKRKGWARSHWNLLAAMEWIFGFSHKSYVEVLTYNMMVFGGGVFGK